MTNGDADHWRREAESLRAQLEESQTNFEDYQEQSRELEEEMEAEMTRTTLKLQEVTSRCHKLEAENGDLQQRLQQTRESSRQHIFTLESQVSEASAQLDDLRRRFRELEQQNDDLERAERVAASSLGEIEGRYGRLLERTALLEEDLEEKNVLIGELQRVRDELGDMHQEVLALRAKTTSDSDGPRPRSGMAPDVPAPALAQEMLSRVKSLEDRLASYRTLIPPSVESPFVLERVRLQQPPSDIPSLNL